MLLYDITPTSKCGAFVIDSNPPATTASECPRAIDCAPNTIDFNPDEHTLLIVVHGTVTGIPDFRDACLAGAWPTPADSTFPKMT